jgi:AcrR family transcriptional regulator
MDLPPQGADGPTVDMPVRISRADRKAATRKRILRAARQVFFRDGFMDTSLDEVASIANIGKGTLYRHFESKAELYVAVLLENGDSFERKMQEAIDPNLGAIDQIKRLGEFYREFWTSHPNYFRIFWAIHNQATIGDLPTPLLAQVKELWERPLRLLEDIVQKGIDDGELISCNPWVTANVLWGMGNSGFEVMVLPEKARLIECDSTSMYKAGLELALKGLSAR